MSFTLAYGYMNGKPKRGKRIEVRLNEAEYQAVKAFADGKGMAIAECIRDWVKSLPPAN